METSCPDAVRRGRRHTPSSVHTPARLMPQRAPRTQESRTFEDVGAKSDLCPEDERLMNIWLTTVPFAANAPFCFNVNTSFYSVFFTFTLMCWCLFFLSNWNAAVGCYMKQNKKLHSTVRTTLT